jgi:hypothetical protein
MKVVFLFVAAIGAMVALVAIVILRTDPYGSYDRYVAEDEAGVPVNWAAVDAAWAREG